jgi:hypothetical protein
VSGVLRTALATLAAGRGRRRCTPRTKRCDFWAWGEENVRPPCCTAHMIRLAAFVDDLLTRHGIMHWLDYGTLLGAVREGQLIAWDEDVDFGMLVADAEAVRALRRDIEAAGHRLDLSEYPDVIRIQLSRANQIHVDLFTWHERDGVLEHGADRTWDWPGMQDRSAFPRTYLEPTEEILLHGRPYPAPGPVDAFLREHRYGEGYLTPVRSTLTSELHFEVDSSAMTPLVERLLERAAERERRLLEVTRARSLVVRMQLWDSLSGRWWIWTALPLEPSPAYVERELAALPDGAHTPTETELARALAWLEQAIAEYEHPTLDIRLRRGGRRVRRLAATVRRRARPALPSAVPAGRDRRD